MTAFYIEVNKADLKYVKSKLRTLETKHPSAIRNAINRTARSTRKLIITSTKAAYTIKGLKIGDLALQTATTAHLDATIKSQGRPRTLTAYKFSVPKSGAKSDITKSGLKEIVSSTGGGHAFMGQGGSISGLITQRRSKDRMDLKVLHSVSVPKMAEQVYTGKRGGSSMEPKVRQTLHDEIYAEVKKLI